MFEQNNTSLVTATAQTDDKTVLYDRTGRTITVSESDVEYWLQKGFSRSIREPQDILTEILPLFDATKQAITEYVQSVLRDGVIDASDESAGYVAHQSMYALENTWYELQQTVSARYGVKQGIGVTLTRENETMCVDPSQVGMYAETGWKVTS